MSVPPELCQVFEDGDSGLQGARAAGMPFVDVRPYVDLPSASTERTGCEKDEN